MKKLLFIIFIVIYLTATNAVAFTVAPDIIVAQFFNASKHGDIYTMDQITASPLKANIKVLLSKNKTYPTFLRSYYHNVDIKVLPASLIGNRTDIDKHYPVLYKRYFVDHKNTHQQDDSSYSNFSVVDAFLKFPDGSGYYIRFLLERDSNGLWKIVDQIIR